MDQSTEQKPDPETMRVILDAVRVWPEIQITDAAGLDIKMVQVFTAAGLMLGLAGVARGLAGSSAAAPAVSPWLYGGAFIMFLITAAERDRKSAASLRIPSPRSPSELEGEGCNPMPEPCASRRVRGEINHWEPVMIRRLSTGEHRLYSRKKDPKTGLTRKLTTAAMQMSFAGGKPGEPNPVHHAETLERGTMEWSDTAASQSKLTADKLSVDFAATGKAKAMVADLITAYRARISNLTWMSSATKEKALAKLAALTIGGFAATDTIDITGIGLAASYSYNSANHQLALLNSGGTTLTTLTLTTVYGGPVFTFATDGAGGTLLGVQAAGTVVNGTHTNGIVLTNFAVNNPVTVAGTANVSGGATRDGVHGDTDDWTPSNAGRITPETAAQQAKKFGIPISTVALGTTSGVVHQNIPTGKGKQTFPLVQQVPVDPTVLKQVASDSGGHFYAAPSASKLDTVYKELGTRLVYNKQFREITVGVTLAAFVLILAAAGLSAWWFRRLV